MELKRYKLGEILELQRGYDLPSSQQKAGNVLVAGSNGIIGYHNEIRGNHPCITVGRSGSVGKVHYYEQPTWAHNTALFVKDFKGNNPQYLYYFLKNLHLDEMFVKGSSVVPSLDRKVVHSLVVPFHKEVVCQKRIALVLSNIDRKIELNRAINQNLEAMAKLLYDYWFVQFDFPNENGKPYKSSGGKMVNANGHIIPEGWTFCKVQDIISNICTGLNPRDNFKLGTGDIKYITVKNLTTNGTLDFTGCDTIDESARAIVHNRSDIQIGDILFASIAPLGRCYLIQSEPTDWDINESVFSIRANTDIVTPSFLYLYFMSDAFIKQATSSSTGSIFKGIRINTLLETELCVPPLSVILKFEERLASTFPLKSKNYEEIQRLSNLRDWLLPMLMNGQATIGD